MKTNFMWFIHNVFGHPLMEIFWCLGFKNLARKVHEITLPRDAKGRV